jgi:hypothetical protein
MLADKRKTQRVDFTSDVSAYPVVSSKSGYIFEVLSQPQTLPAVDISRGGIRLATRHRFVDRSIFKLKIELHKNNPLDVFARLVWSDKHHIGLKFIVLHEDAQRSITHFTHQMF